MPYILMIQTNSCNLTQAASWAVNQSWIDIISVSFFNKSFTGSSRYWKNYPDIIRNGFRKGKIIINSAGNSKKVPWFSNIAGVPEVINVGGGEYYTHGVDLRAAMGVDFLSTFTRFIADSSDTSGFHVSAGTSLAAPTAAGVISKIILTVRRHYNYTDGIQQNRLVYIPEDNISITNKDIRNVVNHTARYWKTLDWRPFKTLWWFYPSPEWWREQNYSLIEELISRLIIAFLGTTFLSCNIPVNPFAPWLQMGWGFIDNTIVNESIDILLGKIPMTEKPVAAERYMKKIYGIRCKYWNEIS